jgi:AhpD family alkylhydroperoxidase
MTNTQSSPGQQSYPERLHEIKQYMGKFFSAHPKVGEAFSGLHTNASTSGELDQKTKELIALAIAVVTHCDDCISFHTHDALQAGASKEEIMEALDVAILMGGGPAMMYALHVIKAVEEFQS